MSYPYRGRPGHSFWRQGVADQAAAGVDPVTSVPFTIAPGDAVATAGSCFAQHLSRTLAAEGFNWMVTELYTAAAGTRDEGHDVFPARFGKLYTARALRQLFDRASGSTAQRRLEARRRWLGRSLPPPRPGRRLRHRGAAGGGPAPSAGCSRAAPSSSSPWA